MHPHQSNFLWTKMITLSNFLLHLRLLMYYHHNIAVKCLYAYLICRVGSTAKSQKIDFL